MAITITYSARKINPKLSYADMAQADKLNLINNLSKQYLSLLEQANHDAEVNDALQLQDSAFLKQTVAPNRYMKNSLQSFMAGLLSQHWNNANKDISVSQLDAISLASRVFAHFIPGATVYEFAESKTTTTATTDIYSRLFG